MTSLDLGWTLRSAGARLFDAWDRFSQWLKSFMPTGLYARSLLIIVTPMVILQSVVAFVFMERHWNTVTYRLSAAVTQDIAALIDFYRSDPRAVDQETRDANEVRIQRIAQERLGLSVDFLPGPSGSSSLGLFRWDAWSHSATHCKKGDRRCGFTT